MRNTEVDSSRLADGLDERQLPAELGQRSGGEDAKSRRKLTRDESLALVHELWGEPSAEGRAWALRVLGLDSPRTAS